MKPDSRTVLEGKLDHTIQPADAAGVGGGVRQDLARISTHRPDVNNCTCRGEGAALWEKSGHWRSCSAGISSSVGSSEGDTVASEGGGLASSAAVGASVGGRIGGLMPAVLENGPGRCGELLTGASANLSKGWASVGEEIAGVVGWVGEVLGRLKRGLGGKPPGIHGCNPGGIAQNPAQLAKQCEISPISGVGAVLPAQQEPA